MELKCGLKGNGEILDMGIIFEMEELMFIFYLCGLFIFAVSATQYLMLHTFDRKNSWMTLQNVNFMRSGSYKYRHIFLINGEDNCLEEVEQLNKIMDIGKKYYLDRELRKMDYRKFDMGKINRAHRNICEEILIDDGNGVIIQNMRKPRDMYDLYCYLLMSKKEENVLVHIENYYGNVDYMGSEFSLERVIEGGGHMIYGKRNRRRELDVKLREEDGKTIFCLDDKSEVELVDNVKNHYFEVKLYRIEGVEEYGVEVLRNDFKVEDKYIYYIGQYYKN